MAVAASSYALATELRTARRTAGRLRDTMQERTSIEVACGVIMGRKRCSYEAALEILATASRHHNIKAMAAAEILLGELPGGAPSPHFAK
jgi:AmiR/NasT family two-component response regulator